MRQQQGNLTPQSNSFSRAATLSLFVLGLVFAALALLVKAPIGLGAAALSSWLRAYPQSLVWLFRSSGIVLLGLGLQLALQRPL